MPQEDRTTEKGWRQDLAQFLSISAMLVAGSIAVSVLSKLPRPVAPNGESPSISTQIQIDSLAAQVRRLTREINTLRDAVSRTPTTTPDVAQLAATLATLEARQKRIEETILANPGKALEVPLLQRELENLRANQQQNLTAVREDVNRVYDLNKWLLGAMAVSVIMMALSNFLKGRQDQQAK